MISTNDFIAECEKIRLKKKGGSKASFTKSVKQIIFVLRYYESLFLNFAVLYVNDKRLR